MRFRLNGKRVDVASHPLARLLDVLRESLGLTGTKEGCGEGECGACTVLLDGEPVNSCLVPVAHAEGREVETIENLDENDPLARAFIAESAAQCGICTPGFLLCARTLEPKASLDAIRTHLAGNLCRCTGYSAIERAIVKTQRRAKKQPKRATRGKPASKATRRSKSERRR